MRILSIGLVRARDDSCNNAVLRNTGVPVAYVAFEGQQHGFRRAANIKRAVDGEFYFYSRVFGFAPAETLEPVTIDNF